ncbi:hypothetical protein NGM10_03475 [Halorussus salilacus]|uniref:DUF7261 family protein n=1 Tax=Halorussus salilacus TaxID=2953750 RepID=UPI00209D1A97|nr:hypothetical protein [Halorussus salilacus]USZ68802.1 hypothetical protein NGM10_03475 [Halorussus salilacus]
MADVSDRGRSGGDRLGEGRSRSGEGRSRSGEGRSRSGAGRPRPDDDPRERAQLILVTGLAVAVTLVALVLLLNTVIYTQNLATRGAQIEDGEAVAFRAEAVDGVGDLLDAENREEYADRDDLDEAVRDGIARYDDLLSRYHAEDGTVAEIRTDTVTTTEGVLVRQTDPSRNFTNVDDEESDWTLAEDVDDARNVRLTVSDDELAADSDDAFAVVLDDGSETWRVPVHEDGDGDIAVGGDSAPDECRVDGSTASVDLTAGTVNGSECPELDYPTEMDSYDIEFENPDRVTGTYELTVDTSEGATVEESNFAAPGSEDSPRRTPAVYAAEFEVHFQTPRVEFHTAVRAAPGEPR